MVNLICYIILKLSYFVYFAKMNTLLDETILLLMKTVSLGMAALSVLAQIIWKVCIQVTYYWNEHDPSFRFTKTNIYWVWFPSMFSLVVPKLPISGMEDFLEGKNFWKTKEITRFTFEGLSWICCFLQLLRQAPISSSSSSWSSLLEMTQVDLTKTGPLGLQELLLQCSVS